MGIIPCHCAVVEAVDSPGMVTKSTYDIKMLFDKINMMWMNRWIHHHALTTAFDDQDLRMQLESWDDSRHLTLPLTIDSGCKHIWHGYHIHFKHNHGQRHYSYDVDGQNNPSPCCYYHT